MPDLTVKLPRLKGDLSLGRVQKVRLDTAPYFGPSKSRGTIGDAHKLCLSHSTFAPNYGSVLSAIIEIVNGDTDGFVLALEPPLHQVPVGLLQTLEAVLGLRAASDTHHQHLVLRHTGRLQPLYAYSIHTSTLNV